MGDPGRVRTYAYPVGLCSPVALVWCRLFPEKKKEVYVRFFFLSLVLITQKILHTLQILQKVAYVRISSGCRVVNLPYKTLQRPF